MAGFKNEVMNAQNVNFGTVPLGAAEITANGQLMIGNAVTPQIRPGVLTSPSGTITIGYAAPNITLDLAGGSVAIDSIGVQANTAPGTNPVLPTGAGLLTINGAAVAAAGIPVRSDSIAANSLQIEVQRASQQAVSAAANAGLASFSSAQFTVDLNGFVTNLNGLPASKLTVDAFTAPGTNPVVPTAAGAFIITGGQVPAGTTANVIRTDSLAANTMTVEVQRSSAQAVSTLSANGVCHFNSAQFTVDANGFVSSLGGTAPWIDEAAPFAAAAFTGYFVTAAVAATLPGGAAQGDIIEIVDDFGGGVVVTANAGQTIRIGNVISSVGGTATTTQQGDSARFVFRAATSQWIAVPGVEGNWILA